MILIDKGLAVRFEGLMLGLSARRVWEHVELRQINPFKNLPARNPIRPQNYIDVIDVSGPVITITGVTLAELATGRHPSLSPAHVEQLLGHAEEGSTQRWLNRVKSFLLLFREQRAVRNIPAPFLPRDKSNPFGIQGLHSALLTWLNAHRTEKASAEQWIHRVKNLGKKGLRAEEVMISGIEDRLDGADDKSIDGATVVKCLAYDDLQLSILPIVHRAGTHVSFSRVRGDTSIKRIKPKLKRGLQTRPHWRDPVMGYWIDEIAWDDLLGPQRGFMAFTYRGQLVTSFDDSHGLCSSPEKAMELADDHAKKLIPKMTARGLWADFRLTGGRQYREWLVTLPHHKQGYISEHFDHRNILFHVRCDIRENANAESVLVLQEVQSDWAQNARRSLKHDSNSQGPIPVPPWLRGWPALALKLMLLHAAHLNVVGLAWTPGSIQVKRWNGLGKKGLIKLYDHTLPSELKRILRPYKRQCACIDVYLPVNFRIEPEDIGYTVIDEDNNCVGTAATWIEAQKLLPDGAHETLTTMHGIRLDESLRQSILRDGFYAWGTGVH